MHNHTYLQERIDMLAMFYMDKHYDIKSMPIAEFIKTFDKVRAEIVTSVETSENK